MAEIVIMGAGLGGAVMAYEMKDKMRPQDKLTVVTKDPIYHFVPSNPVGRGRLALPPGGRGRSRPDVGQARHRLQAGAGGQGVPQREPPGARRRFGDPLRLSRHRHRSRARLRRDRRPRPRRQHVVDLPHRPRAEGGRQLRGILQESRADRHRRGAGRLVLRPGLRVHLHPRDRTPPPPYPRPRADDLRHRRALHRPSRPRRRRRHQGPARKRNARAPHQVDHQRAGEEGRAGQDDDRGSRRRRLGQGDQRAAVRLFDDAARLPRHRAVARRRRPGQSARLRHRRQAPAESRSIRMSSGSACASPSRRSARRRCRAACRRPAS